jgi:ribonucleotide reductase beta subunit family protein with ferritin-like domain
MSKTSSEGPCSPMKKLKILSEKQNVQEHVSNTVVSPLKPIKELNLKTMVTKTPEKKGNIDQQNFENAENKIEEVVTEEKEPLLQETSNQYVIFPINHDDMWSMYKELVGNFWSVTETIENLDALALDYEEKKYMKLFTSIFASPDSRGLVNDNFAEEFCKIIQVTEAKFFFGHQLFVQNIHYEMYNKLLENYAPTNDEKKTLFKIVEGYDSVQDKRSWISKWKYSHFTEQLMAATCLHGLFFSAIEITANWLNSRTKRNNNGKHEIVEILEKILHDQQLQMNFSCLMMSHLKNRPSDQRILETINQAAKIEFSFLLNGLNLDLIGVGPQEVLEIIDKNTKALKSRLFSTFEVKKKTIQSESDIRSDKNREQENRDTNQNKDRHQKLVFDEDF